MIGSRALPLALFATTLFATDLASAATISFDRPSLDGLTVGDRVTLEIQGRGFTSGSAGGGLDLSWDPAVLAISSLDDVELLFPGDRFIFDRGTLDTVAGTLTNLATNSFSGTPGANFTIARITVTALAAGTTQLGLALGSFAGGGKNVWTTAAGEVIDNLVFEPMDVTVAPVPLPAGLWLLPGALAVLGARLQREAGASA